MTDCEWTGELNAGQQEELGRCVADIQSMQPLGFIRGQIHYAMRERMYAEGCILRAFEEVRKAVKE